MTPPSKRWIIQVVLTLRFLTVAEAADRLGVSKSTANRLIVAGDLICSQPGGARRSALIFEPVLEQYIRCTRSTDPGSDR